MNGWQLSLRDVFVATAVIAIGCGVVMGYLQLDGVDLDMYVAGVWLIAFIALAVILSIALSDTHRFAHLLSYSAIVYFSMWLWIWASQYIQLMAIGRFRDARLLGVAELMISFVVALGGAYITRSLKRRRPV